MDPHTKGLPPKAFHEHTAHRGGMSSKDIQLQWEFVTFQCSFDIDTLQFSVYGFRFTVSGFGYFKDISAEIKYSVEFPL